MIAGALEYFERTLSKGRRIIRGTEGLSKVRQKSSLKVAKNTSAALT